MKLLERLVNGRRDEARDLYDQLLADAYATYQYGGNSYTIPNTTYGAVKGESVGGGYTALVNAGYKGNGVVAAVLNKRLEVFSQARFAFRALENARPGDFVDSPALELLRHPWPGGTTGEMLARMEQDASLAGNCFLVLRLGDKYIRRLRPDWVTIVHGSPEDSPDSELHKELVGYLYKAPQSPGEFLLPEDVAHYSPLPDPLSTWRGMSWLTPVIREIDGDTAAQVHKQKFFENGATPNMVVKFDREIGTDKFDWFVEKFKEGYEGVRNAYKTLFLGGGADTTVVGSSFQQMTFKAVQGAGETRIAAAGGVPPVIVGLSEGLQAATYSNYAQARRAFADTAMWYLWSTAARSLETLVPAPAGHELAHDARDIPFLREDAKDDAEIRGRDAQTIKALVEAGYEPDAVVEAVTAGDLARLKNNHSGLTSVQLLPPGTVASPQGTPDADA